MKTRLSLLVLSIALFAIPSFAQQQARLYMDDTIQPEGAWYETDSYSSGLQLDNPCTAAYDWTWVDYNVFVAQEGEITAAGTERVLFDESTTMGGSTYAASGSSMSDVDYKSQPFSVRKYYKVNTWDNFHVVTVLNFDPSSRQTTVTVETACGDGTPASAQ